LEEGSVWLELQNGKFLRELSRPKDPVGPEVTSTTEGKKESLQDQELCIRVTSKRSAGKRSTGVSVCLK